MQRIINKLDRFFRNSWHIGVLDFDKGLWLADPDNIAYLKAENANGRHILIQPDRWIEPYYLLADDLSPDLLCRHHQNQDETWRPGRMVIETSPANYQVWIHSSRPIQVSEKQFWLKKMNSDPGANPNRRWGRHPGFFNRKMKHRNEEGNYPLSKLIWIDWRNSALIPPLPQSIQNKQASNPYRNKRKTNKSICREDYNRRNESVTDFAFALALIRRNYTKNEVIQRILTERKNWTNHAGQKRTAAYLDRTVEKALKIIHNNPTA